MNRTPTAEQASAQDTAAPEEFDEAQTLLEASHADPWAQISPSVYENARVVTVAPWLGGAGRRLRFLCEEQATDGGWGISGFRLVPTLSAVEALLTAWRRGEEAAGAGPEYVRRAAVRGIETLCTWLTGGQGSEEAEHLPDTVAIEVVVPGLIAQINARLDECRTTPLPGLPERLVSLGLPLPRGTDDSILAALRAATAGGRTLPPKLWHAWEILSPGRPFAREVRPVNGSVSCSPAATAAWLGGSPTGPESLGAGMTPMIPATGEARAALRFLEDLQQHRGGLLPLGGPMPNFERAWILASLATHGVPHQASEELLDDLDAVCLEEGMSAGDGLPPDADDTAVGLYALARHGRRRRPDSLLRYFNEGHFCTYPDERTASPTANAHALEALGYWTSRYPEDVPRFGAAVVGASDWLLSVQNADGSWTDKWNGSPYYATASCVEALAAYAGETARPAVERAVSWVLNTRHPGGLWGHGAGTVEETAYAVWILRWSQDHRCARQVKEALDAARDTLTRGTITEVSTPLWIGKDVYTPVRIARAARLSALHELVR
ncbi:prenyltransferase/squalene oxidase repeat-containing protein [Streptomyces odonnellii]|uniref:prenyltransferase/squalene oxidase repeat-containing protein n=1 Tax=Streptomyces odonnellii TaxID=1417980 RepID=UPI000B25F972|nr:prenyltransferase/squalene oxidase repeat-containing protein [Streptomyces odonnellii]